jgi:hypothetical protein
LIKRFEAGVQNNMKRNWSSVLTALLLVACSVHSDRVATVKSPSGQFEATLDETNGGATTDFGYVVSVVPAGGTQKSTRVADLYGAIRNERAYGVNLTWIDDHTLEIRFLKTSRGGLEQSSPVSIGGALVKVQLHPGVRDATAPGGGMAYNLERHRR